MWFRRMGVRSAGGNGILPVAMFSVLLAVITRSRLGSPGAALLVLHVGGSRPALPDHLVYALAVEVLWRDIGQRPREEV